MLMSQPARCPHEVTVASWHMLSCHRLISCHTDLGTGVVFGMPGSQMGMLIPVPATAILNHLSAKTHLERQQMVVQMFKPLPPMWEPKIDFWFLGLDLAVVLI